MSNATINLMDCGADEFNEYVNADVRGTAPEEISEALRQPEVVERWHNCLLSHKSNVEAQLVHGKAEKAQKFADCVRKGPAGKQEWLDYLAEQQKWRSGAIRFKNGAEVKLVEAKQYLSRYASEAPTTQLLLERNAALQRVLALEKGIINHQEAVTNAPDDDNTDEADENLWNLVVSD